MKGLLPPSRSDWPSSRRCLRLSPCLLVLCFLLFFLLLQLDLLPQITAPQVKTIQSQVSLYLHRLRPTPSSPSIPASPPPPPPELSSASTSSSQPSSSPPSPSPLPESSSALSTAPTLPAVNLTSVRKEPSPSPSREPRVAICLVGGARAFELTGFTIKKYLLQSVPNSDVFLHAPFDKDSYKLSLLKDVSNQMHVRIFSPKSIPENRVSREVLTASGSPNGIQGLLQYFNLVEGCLDMISHVQLKQNFTYEWIIRTRLDGYWNGYFPSLSKRNHSAYTVPLGSQFGGLNDRIGIGSWETTKVALARLSLIPILHSHGLRALNSETFFKQQLKVKKISAKKSLFPFCILSHRRYGWPPGRWGVPVLSISSKGNLNGAKCRPCSPVSTGHMAKKILQDEDRFWAWPGDVKEPELCNADGAWDSNWQNIFDEVAGPEIAMIRKETMNQNIIDCVQAVKAWQEQVLVWDAPTSDQLCEKGLGGNG